MYIPKPAPAGKFCLSFRYSMYAFFNKHMGNLLVTVKDNIASRSDDVITTIIGRDKTQNVDDTIWFSHSVDVTTAGYVSKLL